MDPDIAGGLPMCVHMVCTITIFLQLSFPEQTIQQRRTSRRSSAGRMLLDEKYVLGAD